MIFSVELNYTAVQVCKLVFYLSTVLAFISFRKPIGVKSVYFGAITFSPFLALATLVFGYFGVAVITLFLYPVFPKSEVVTSNGYNIYSTEISFMKLPEKFEITKSEFGLFERKIATFECDCSSELKKASVTQKHGNLEIGFKKTEYLLGKDIEKDTVLRLGVR